MADATRSVDYVLAIRGHADEDIDLLAAAARLADRAMDSLTDGVRAADRALASASLRVRDAGGELARLGGQLGSIPGLETLAPAVTAVGDAFESLTSPVGLGVAALLAGTAIVVGTTAAMYGLVASADEWLDRLDELGAGDDLISSDQREQLDQAEKALAGVEAAAKRLGVVLASEFADDVEYAANVLVGLLASLEEVGGGIAKVIEGAGKMTAGALFGPAGMLVAGVTGMDGDTIETFFNQYADRGAGITAGFVPPAEDPPAEDPPAGGGAGGRGGRSAAADEAAALALMRQRIGAEQQLDQLRRALSADLLDDVGKAEAAYERTVEQLQRLQAERGGDDVVGAEIEALFADAVARLDRDIAAAEDAAIKTAQDTVRMAGDAIAEAMLALEVAVAERRATSLGAKVSGGVAMAADAVANPLGALGALGPAGAATAAVVSLGPDFAATLDETLGGALATVENLPENLGTIIGETIPDFIANLIPALGELVFALPGEIATALVGLPVRLLDNVGGKARESGSAFLETIGSGNYVDAVAASVDAYQGGDGAARAARARMLAEAGNRRASSRGERDLADAAQRHGPGRVVHLHAGVVTPNALRDLDREMGQAAGPRGRGYTFGAG